MKIKAENLEKRAEMIAKVKGFEENCLVAVGVVLCAKPGKRLPFEAVAMADVVVDDQGHAIKNRWGEVSS